MKKIFIISMLCCFTLFNSFSQTYCSNSDFEEANLVSTPPGTIIIATINSVNGWTVNGGTNTGTVNSCNLNTCCPTFPSNASLIGTTQTSGYVDPNIGVANPIFSVFGAYTNSSTAFGSWFCKLNDDIPNSGINKLSKLINITPVNYLFKFAILPVMQNATHACCGLPTIKVRLVNPLTNSVIPSPQLAISTNTACSTTSCMGPPYSFSTCPSNPSFVYTNWQQYTYDLSSYIGLQIKIEVIVTDCSAGDHSSYAYFDSQCSPFDPFIGCPGGSPNLFSTCGASTVQASAPIGIGPFLWSGPAGWSGNGSTTQSVSLTMPGVYTISCNPPGVCTPITKTFTLNYTPPATATLTSSQSTACAGGNTIVLTGSPSGGVYSGSFVTGNTFNPVSAGNYSVSYTYTDTNGCSDTATSNINVIICATGINNIASSHFSAELYPQPTKDIVNISLINSYNKNIEIKIFDITGKEIEKKELEVSQSKTQFSTLHLPNGIYILQLKNSQGQVAVKRLVVSK